MRTVGTVLLRCTIAKDEDCGSSFTVMDSGNKMRTVGTV